MSRSEISGGWLKSGNSKREFDEMDTDLEQRICQECGFCCDGTLFERVRIREDESLESLREVQLRIRENEDGSWIMMQPCSGFQHGRCQTYHCRPRRCGEFRCQLLRQLESTDINLETALERIRTVKGLRREFNREMGEVLPQMDGEPLVRRLRRFRKEARKLKGSSLRLYRQQRKQLLELKERLQACLDQHFYEVESDSEDRESHGGKLPEFQ